MKLVDFTPWQNCCVTVPVVSDNADIIYRITPLPRMYKQKMKRAKLSDHEQNRKNRKVFCMQPTFSLTASSHICILGHRSFEEPSPKYNGCLKEVPEWLYSSRPGSLSSLLPVKDGDIPKQIGAIVDQESRTVFALQEDNRLLKIWSLDAIVTGPDDDVGEDNVIQKVSLDSSVVCMEVLPYDRCRYNSVNIAGNDVAGCDKVLCGVTGLLSSGQMFIALKFSVSQKVKVGFFGDFMNRLHTSSRLNLKSARKVTNGDRLNDATAEKCIFSVAGCASVAFSNMQSERITSKRKHSCTESPNEDNRAWGEISLTTFSLDLKKGNSVLIRRHCVVVPSSISGVGEDLNNESILGTYSKNVVYLNLLHKIEDKKDGGNLKITMLNDTTAAALYHASDGQCYCANFNPVNGEIIDQSFPIYLSNMSPRKRTLQPFIVDIGGLSNSIVALLSSDDILIIIDTRRATIVHKVDVRKVLAQYGFDNGKLRIATHHSGIIGIVNYTQGVNSARKITASVCFARVGVFDSIDLSCRTELTLDQDVPPLEGSYNLAGAISSSVATLVNNSESKRPECLSPVDVNVEKWFSRIQPKKSLETSDKKTLDEVVIKICTELESFPDREEVKGTKANKSQQKTFSFCFKESLITVSNLRRTEQKRLQNGKYRMESNSDTNLSYIPQIIIDTALSSAIDIILNPLTSIICKIDANDVVIQCIKSGKVSGRVHFERSSRHVYDEDDIFRSIIYSLNKSNNISDESKKVAPDQVKPSLRLIDNLLNYCHDSISEHILVAMLHFLVCHVTCQDFMSYWGRMSTISDYHHSEINLLEERLQNLRKQFSHVHIKKTSKSDEREEKFNNSVTNLQIRLFTAHQLFFVRKIVTYSKCNEALLREALKYGLTHASNGEVEVLMKMFAKLLHETTADNDVSKVLGLNRISCIVQWLSALTDTHMGIMYRKSTSEAIERIKAGVSKATSQGHILLNLNDLLNHVDIMLDKRNKLSSRAQKNKSHTGSIPEYCIETLIF